MVVIRLARVGKKNSPAYRVVVADKKRAVKRKFIEIIGHYNPTLKPKISVISKERAIFWIKNGAQPSSTVNNLMVNLGVLPKSKLLNIKYKKDKKKKDIKAEKSDQPKEAPKVEAKDDKIKEELPENAQETEKTEDKVEDQNEVVETQDKIESEDKPKEEITKDNKELDQ